MAGSIFVIDQQGSVSELRQEAYASEDLFQRLLAACPGLLAGDQIRPDDPRRWILVSREMGVPSESGGGSQWYLDHLFLDQDGIPTLVEVKCSSDLRLRREVVAQMLDYAANGTAYWSAEQLRSAYEQQGGNLSDDLGIAEEEAYWQGVDSNLKLGRLRLIFASDAIPTSLQRIIEFLNSQMSQTEVLGLEIKQFVGCSGLKTLVPRIIGQTAAALQEKSSGRVQWDEESFAAQVRQLHGKEAEEVALDLLRRFEALGCRIWWGQGSTHSCFIAIYDGKQKQLLCSVYPSTRTTLVELQFQYLKAPFDSPEARQRLKQAFEQVPGIRIPQERLTKRPSFGWEVLRSPEAREGFIHVFAEMIDEIKRYEAGA